MMVEGEVVKCLISKVALEESLDGSTRVSDYLETFDGLISS